MVRGIRAGGAALALGLWVAGASPGLLTGRASAAAPTPAAALSRPVAVVPELPPVAAGPAKVERGPSGTPAPAVTLSRPLPLPAGSSHRPAERAVVDPSILPASFASGFPAPPRPTVRAQGADASRPLPPGPLRSVEGAQAVTSEEKLPLPRRDQSLSTPVPGSLLSNVVEGDGSCGPLLDCGEDFYCDEEGPWFPGKRCRLLRDRRCYFSAEYLMWWMEDAAIPPLVTTGTLDSMGFLNAPGTVVLFGGSGTGAQQRHGARFTAGGWFDACETCGLEGSVFFLGSRTTHFEANSMQFPVLTRPFFNLNFNQEFGELVGFPGRTTGAVTVDSTSRLWGADLNLRKNLLTWCRGRWDLLGGVRYLELSESLDIREAGLVAPTEPRFPGTTFLISDSFRTRNHFYGGQIGTVLEFRRGRWSLDLQGKVALGSTHQVADIQGSQILVSPTGAMTMFNGGLLALPTNSGRFSRDVFSVVPEAGVKLGYQLTPRIQFFVGYNFLYWTNVIRPGDQIDRVIDVTRVPNFAPPGVPPTGQARPTFAFRDTDVWVQGVSLGLEFHW